jgi:hypothetical protein
MTSSSGRSIGSEIWRWSTGSAAGHGQLTARWWATTSEVPLATKAVTTIKVFRVVSMSDGKVTSYSAPFLIGADVRTLTLVNDQIGQRAYDTVRAVPEGKIAILQYKMPKPGTIEPATKLSFETRIGNQGCGVTYYE